MSIRDSLAQILPAPVRHMVYDQYRQFKYYKNRLTAHNGVVTSNGVKLDISTATLEKEVVALIMRGDYEGREARMVRMFLKPSDVVLELGAGIGYIGLLCAKIVGPKQVHSFEANPLMQPIIHKNYVLNGIEPNLEIGMLSDADGEATLHVPDLFWAASTKPIEGARKVSTRCIELNRTIEQIRPTFMIMDIEGGEVSVIDHLKPSTLRKIAMEQHPHVVGMDAICAMEDKLLSMGFQRRWISNAGEHAYYEREE